ncbi:MAG: ABC transporter ATP-binding protein [Planctomycetes bacterium]|nr:ABC transporter ATP-binding protein [Planctomycetota bacterium]
MSLIRLENVTKGYQSESNGLIIALKDINLEIEAGEFICVVGPSGCGKSTILNMIAGFDYPTEGRICFNDDLITGPGPERIMVFQEHALMPWLNIRRNIEFGLTMNGKTQDERNKIVDDLLKITHLERFANSWVHELSGGMKQKTALARALAPNPKILLMDEPFAALDAQTRRMMQDELLNMWSLANKTILFITHNVNEAVTLADRVVVLTKRPGRIKKIIPVRLMRPRDRTGFDFNTIRQEVYGELEVEVTQAYANALS